MPGGRARTVLRFICAVVIVALARPAIAADAASPVHGLWVWKTSSVLRGAQDARALRDFCRSADINEVYLSLSAKAGKSDEQEMGDLIALLHRSGIRVEALLSSVSADAGGQAREKLLDHVRAIVRFNQQRAADRFDGIHLDVEPQQRAENKGQGNLQFLPGLVNAFRAVRALTDVARLSVNADIQSKLLKGDSEQRRALLASLPRLTLMLYELDSPNDGKSAQDKAQKLREMSEKYLNMAYQGLEDRKFAKLAIALRTPDYENLLPQMLRTLDEANAKNPHYLGWARHSYNDFLQAQASSN